MRRTAWSHHLPENWQNGQAGLGGWERRRPGRDDRASAHRGVLNWLGPEELQNATVRELTAELASQGLDVTERYVKEILDQHRQPASQPQRKRGSGARRPRR